MFFVYNILLQVLECLKVVEATAHPIINASSISDIVHTSKEEIDDLKVAFILKD